jgi:hypothetical protein
MLNIVKALLLISVLLIIFIPNTATGQILYFVVFLAAMGLVYLYWRLSYWVSDSDVKSIRKTDTEPLLSIFAAKVPSMTSDDLLRGRLIITEDSIELYQLPKKKRKDSPACEKTWSLPKSQVESFGFGKVVGARKGFIIYTNDDQISFTSLPLYKHRERLFTAMGWPYTPPEKTTGTKKRT